MKRNIFVICYLIFISIISGCGSGQLFGPTLTPTPTITSTPTLTLTPTITPTSTVTLTPTPTTGKIEGNLSWSDSIEPVAKTIILVVPGKDELSKEIAIDEQGKYSFAEIQPGEYVVNLYLTFEGCKEVEIELPQDMPWTGAGLQFDKHWLLGPGQDQAGNFLLVALSEDFRVNAGDLLKMDFTIVSCK